MSRRGLPRTGAEERRYSFFSHRDCEFFPCHAGADPENFNCLFCYCPLYALGRECGGEFRYSESGVKDCTRCLFPHRRENFAAVVSRFGEIASAMARLERIGRGEEPR